MGGGVVMNMPAVGGRRRRRGVGRGGGYRHQMNISMVTFALCPLGYNQWREWVMIGLRSRHRGPVLSCHFEINLDIFHSQCQLDTGGAGGGGHSDF